MKKLFLATSLSALGLCAQTHPLQAVIEAARVNAPALKGLLTGNAPNLKAQGAAFVWGQDYLFAAARAKILLSAPSGTPARRRDPADSRRRKPARRCPHR